MINVDGITGYVDFPFPPNFTNIPSNDFSVSCWLLFDNVSSTFVRALDITDDSSNFFQIAISNGVGLLTCVMGDAGTVQTIEVDSAISAGVKHHVVATWAAGTNDFRFYLDSVEQTTVGFVGLTAGTAAQFNFGRRSSGGNHAEVNCEDLRLYSRGLVQADIERLFTARGVDGIIEKLTNRWPMNDLPDGTVCGGNQPFIDSTNAGVNSTSLIVNVPSVSTGNLMFAAIGPEGAGATAANVTTPSGWTPVANQDTPAAPSRPSLFLYRRVASSSEPATYTFAINQTCFINGIMATYDHNKVQTIPEEISIGNTGTSINPISPAVTPSASAMVIGTSVSDDLTLPSSLPDFFPVGSSGREGIEGSGVGNGAALGLADQLIPPGLSGSGAWLLFQSDEWAAFSVTFLTIGGSGFDADCVKDITNTKEHGVPSGTTEYRESVLTYRKRSNG